MSQILFIHLFLRIGNNFIVQNLFTYLDLYTKHQGFLSLLLLGVGGGIYTANLPAGLNQWEAGIHLLAFWQFQLQPQRAGGQRIIGYFSTMRMTIYLLDGCSADYVIIKNNFHPLPCIGAISDGFPNWIIGNTHPHRTMGNAVPSCGWSELGDKKGRGWGYGKLSCIT